MHQKNKAGFLSFPHFRQLYNFDRYNLVHFHPLAVMIIFDNFLLTPTFRWISILEPNLLNSTGQKVENLEAGICSQKTSISKG